MARPLLLLLLAALACLASAELTGYTSTFDCELVSFHPQYSKTLEDVQTNYRNRDFQEAKLPFGNVSSANPCEIDAHTPHKLQFPAINYLNYARRYVGLNDVSFDCVATLRTDDVAAAMLQSKSLEPKLGDLCYKSTMAPFIRDSVRVVHPKSSNSNGKDIYNVFQESLYSLTDKHLQSRRRLLNPLLRDFTASAVADDSDSNIYYMLAMTGHYSAQPSGFVAYPPPGYVLKEWTDQNMLWSFHSPLLTLKNVTVSMKEAVTGTVVSTTIDLNALNDSLPMKSVAFTVSNGLTLKKRYVVDVTWTGASGDAFEYRYTFFYVDMSTTASDLSWVTPCTLTQPTYPPLASTDFSVFDCRNLSAHALYNRPLKDLVNRYKAYFSTNSPQTTSSTMAEPMCAVGGETPKSAQQDGLAYINLLRYYVGSPEIVYNDTHQTECDNAAAFIALNNVLTHNPDEDVGNTYKCATELAKKCLSGANIGMGWSTIRDSVRDMINDNNVDTLGHRRFLMNPLLTSTTIAALKSTTKGYAAHINNQDNAMRDFAMPFYAFPPPGFALKEMLPNQGNEWNSFHHAEISKTDATLTVVNGRGATMEIETDFEKAMGAGQPLPAMRWRFLTPPALDKYTVTASWKVADRPFFFNYTFYLVDVNTFPVVREASQCDVSVFTTSFDCETLSAHPAYNRSYTDLMTQYQSLLAKPLPFPYASIDYRSSSSVTLTSEFNVTANTMFDILSLLRSYASLPEAVNIANGPNLQPYQRLSSKCLGKLYIEWFRNYTTGNPICTDGGACYGASWTSFDCTSWSQIRKVKVTPTETIADGFTVMKAMLADPADNYAGRRNLLNYGMKDVTVQLANWTLADGQYLAMVLHTPKPDMVSTNPTFIAYPPPGIALKELQAGPFSFHHEDLSEPLTMSVTKKDGSPAHFTLDTSAINSYPTRGVFFEIEDVQVGERYRVRVTWNSNGRNFDVIYLYYFVDTRTPPALTPGCVYNPNFVATEDPDFAGADDPISGGTGETVSATTAPENSATALGAILATLLMLFILL